MTDQAKNAQNPPADSKAWTPVKGDEIEGTILHIGMGGKPESKNGLGRYPMLDFAVSKGTKNGVEYTPGTEVVVHAFHGLLASQLKDMRVQPGDDIRIRYDGQLDTVNEYGKQTHIYHVRPLAAKEFNWANVVE